MEKEIDLLKEQIKDNAIRWFSFEKDVDYKILNRFSKEKEGELKKIVEELSQKERIIVLLENQLSIKNICQETSNTNNLYTRKEIEELLESQGLKYKKFYYILPDLDTANVIFTDKKLPDEDSINRNIVLHEPEIIVKNKENDLFKSLIRQDINLFKIFANSFLIECCKEEFDDNGIEYVSFSNIRKQEYRIQTMIKGEFVYKKAFNESAIKHLNNIKNNIDILKKLNIKTLDKYDDTGIISEYQKKEKTLDLIIKEKIRTGDMQSAIKIIKDLFDTLKEKLVPTDKEKNVFDKFNIKYEEKNIDNLTFIEYGFWDMTLKNIFFINNEFYFYDQEWIENKVPLEFIIYRAFYYDNEITKLVNLEKIFEQFNITEENTKIFKELDDKIQSNIKDEKFWEYHSNMTTEETIKKEKEEMFNESLKLLNGKDARIKFLEENMEKTVELLRQKEIELQAKENQIMSIQNSTSWKITKPLRDIKSKKRRKNEN